MKKQLHTRIRYEGQRLEPGVHEFKKEFIDANPDFFQPETRDFTNVPQFESALQSQIDDMENTVDDLTNKLSAKDEEIKALKVKLAASGGN